MSNFNTCHFLLGVVFLLTLPGGALCFGAGDVLNEGYLHNIAFRHGDLGEALLTVSKVAGGAALFSKNDIMQIYFGNWLRDYSQVMDRKLLKTLPYDMLLIVVQVLSLMNRGYATKEFEVKGDRLGVYQHVEHIDNPKGYEKDCQSVHPGLRGPVSDVELEVNPSTGMKNYIATENCGYDTAAALVRRKLTECIISGRASHGNHDSYRLLGTALHTLEDFTAHSNWCELTLLRMGHDAVYCYVGDETCINDPKGRRVPPLTTGTFGALDIVVSMLGEGHDHLQAASMSDFRSKAEDSRNSNVSELLNLLKPIISNASSQQPDDLTAESTRLQAQNRNQFQLSETLGFIWSVLEWWEEVTRYIKDHPIITTIQAGIEIILKPVTEPLKALEKLFWALVVPVVEPIFDTVSQALKDVNTGLATDKSLSEVFTNPKSSDPSHSLLAKDHFENALNEPAGKVAQAVVVHCVTKVVKAWGSTDDINSTIDDILKVFHHPFFSDGCAIQEEMLRRMKSWMDNLASRNEVLANLTKESVRAGKNVRALPTRLNGPENGITTTLNNIMNTGGQVVKQVGDTIGNVAEEGRKGLESTYDQTSRGLENVAKEGTKTAEQLGNQLGQTVDEGLNQAKKGFNDIIPKIPDFIPSNPLGRWGL